MEVAMKNVYFSKKMEQVEIIHPKNMVMFNSGIGFYCNLIEKIKQLVGTRIAPN